MPRPLRWIPLKELPVKWPRKFLILFIIRRVFRDGFFSVFFAENVLLSGRDLTLSKGFIL